MGLEVALIATALSTAVSVAGTLEERKAVKQQAQTNAKIERRNSVQQQLDLEHNVGVEKANRQEVAMEAGHQRKQIMRQAKQERSSMIAQTSRQGLTLGGTSLDSVLQQQAFNEELALQDVKFQQAQQTTTSRGRGRTFTRDAFAVRAIGETNAQATLSAGKNKARSLGLSAVGQGLSGASQFGQLLI